MPLLVNPPVPLPMDAVKNAAVRYRAIMHNNEVGSNAKERAAWDDRIGIAEVELEASLLGAEMMTADDAIEEITIQGRAVRVLLDSGRKIDITT